MVSRCRSLAYAAAAAAMAGAGSLAIPSVANAAVTQTTTAIRAAGPWGNANAVPGLAALNTGKNADVTSVSCPSAGNCVAGGYYQNHGKRGFVVRETNGVWGHAFQVPGLAALNKGGPAQVNEVSCASAGNCAASGFYRDGSGHQQGFVASESNGTWRQAIEVPGLGNLNTGGNADVKSVSCASAGNCAAGGTYVEASVGTQAFVVSESNGRWHKAIKVPGLPTPNKGWGADVKSVSCASAGNCTAGGYYTPDIQQAFVVSEKNGTWGTVQEVAGALNVSGASVNSVSCASAGNCSAGGEYGDRADNSQAFVIDEVNGTWTAAHETASNLNSNGGARVWSVSCASPGNCSAGGDYDNDYNQGFVVTEKNGVWGTAINPPGLQLLEFRFSDVYSVSCSSAGNCAAGGDYETEGGNQGFVVIERNFVWHTVTNVPGLGSLSRGPYAGVESVSCPSATRCVAGGYYTQSGRPVPSQGFLT